MLEMLRLILNVLFLVLRSKSHVFACIKILFGERDYKNKINRKKKKKIVEMKSKLIRFII